MSQHKTDEKVVNRNICHAFQIDSAHVARSHMDLERIINYGSQANGIIFHTWDAGERWLGRCRKCGGLVLVQESEYHGFDDDDDYTDYFPVASEEEAQSYNEKYDGYQIEKKFPGKYLMTTNTFQVRWSMQITND